MELLKSHRTFKGRVEIWQHASTSTQTPMTFSIFLPDQRTSRKAVFWLSGLTCTHENFFHKAGAFAKASELGLIIVAPDTSPRGAGIAGENDSWDFGVGAGFYLDATREPWRQNYRMFSYVTKELRKIVTEKFEVDDNKISISGHSMGGHGALVLGLREPERYRAISAFAPICAPTQCAWGKKAFANYLLEGEGALWDASELAAGIDAKRVPPILIDQGLADEYLETQLMPEKFREACQKSGVAMQMRSHENYDHSYYFIATFFGEHLEFLARN